MSKVDELIEKFKEFKEELNKAAMPSQEKGVHVSSNPAEPGRSQMGIMARLGESGKAKQEVKAKIKEMKAIKPKMVKAEETLKADKNGQWSLDKAACEECGEKLCKCMDKAEKPDMGHSAFTMDHVKQVAGMRDHGAAKILAHAAVDASTANKANRAKLKNMINSSRNSAHLAQGMSNHILAHPSENLKVGRG